MGSGCDPPPSPYRDIFFYHLSFIAKSPSSAGPSDSSPALGLLQVVGHHLALAHHRPSMASSSILGSESVALCSELWLGLTLPCDEALLGAAVGWPSRSIGKPNAWETLPHQLSPSSISSTGG